MTAKQVIDRLVAVSHQRRWEALPNLLADEVRLDYTSLTGGEPITATPPEVASTWEATLGELDAMQHLISNHVVKLADGDSRAIATAQFVATHVLPNSQGGPIWTLGGHDRWPLRRAGDRWLDMNAGIPADRLSKVALNALTRMWAAELTRPRILVDSICPGWVATDMGEAGGRPVADGAAGIVWAATLPDDGPTAGFFRDRRPIAW